MAFKQITIPTEISVKQARLCYGASGKRHICTSKMVHFHLVSYYLPSLEFPCFSFLGSNLARLCIVFVFNYPANRAYFVCIKAGYFFKPCPVRNGVIVSKCDYITT